MEAFLSTQGLPALFVLSFLAATLLPLGSEWLLLVLLSRGEVPALAVAVAASGNTLGALTTYLIGLYGGPLLAERVLRIDAAARQRAETRYARFGSWSLLLSWLPVIGDPLCLVGGLLRVPVGRFVLLVGSGKLARYAALALLATPSLGAG
jgi:membrane protein YqaA with SNARE-associated domain